jgi:hypothetical protein
MFIVVNTPKPFTLDVQMLIQGSYGASAALITLAAIIGKVTFP